jgi:tubulin polyglutamylase TTLL4
VNNIPSLHADTIDSFVNRPMVAEMFNIVGFHVSKDVASKNQKAVLKKIGLEKLGVTNICFDEKMYSKIKSDDDVNKQNKFKTDKLSCEKYISNILDDISSSDARIIIRSEDELSHTVSWTRIFPTPSTHPYLQFLSSPSYPDHLLDTWEGEYGKEKRRRTEYIEESLQGETSLESSKQQVSFKIIFDNLRCFFLIFAG